MKRDLEKDNGTKLMGDCYAFDNTKRNVFELYDILVLVVGFIIIFTNLIVVVSSGLIGKKERTQKSTYLLLGNVSLADLMTALSEMIRIFIVKRYPNKYICTFLLGLLTAIYMECVFSIGLLAIDRFIYIKFSFCYQKWIYPKRTRIIIGASWIISLFICIFVTFSSDCEKISHCKYIVILPIPLFSVIYILTFLPMVLVVVLYSAILSATIKRISILEKARKYSIASISSTMENFDPSNESKISSKNLKVMCMRMKDNARKMGGFKMFKSIFMVFFTAGGFILTYGPLELLYLVYMLKCTSNQTTQECNKLVNYHFEILSFLRILNCLINPLLYVWWHKQYREFIIRYLKRSVLKSDKVFSRQSSQTSISETYISVFNK